jgi:hypothetical protein
LGSSKDNIQTPIIEEDFFRCNRTHSIHDNLCIINVEALDIWRKKLTRVSGETRFATSAIACALDKTPADPSISHIDRTMREHTSRSINMGESEYFVFLFFEGLFDVC